MATNFPASLDTLTNPSATDTLDSPPHDEQHADANDAIEALQAKVGVDGSAVTTSIDYQLNTGYRYHSTVYFTSSGSFTKASYPWLRAIRVKVQGGGGAGGGLAAISSGHAGFCSGGGGGAYAESFITDIAGLSASETVTVGAGGVGTTTTGNPGGMSSFGSLVTAGGGGGGSSFQTTASFGAHSNQGGVPGTSGTGDLVLAGGGGDVGFAFNEAVGKSRGGSGGSSHLGGGAPAQRSNTAPANGKLYGGGGAGRSGSENDPGGNGGDGGNGIVIVELYA